MLKAIDLGELVNPQKICYKTDTVLKNHNPKATKTTSKLFSTDPCEGSSKMIVPIKEYSNKFLRQSAFKQNEKDRHAAKHNRFTPIVNKHKAFQRKYQNMLSRKHYICKTEPNENEYQCFTTANNFYKTNEQPEIQRGRIKTESMIQKHLSRGDLSSYDKEEQKDVLYITPFEEECVKVKGRQEIPKKQEKISTSRALELFSKIISKDKGDLLDRMKSCNQKKLLKDRIMESSKNLEAKQIVLLEKQKKYSFVEKGENRVSLKTGLKYRKKKSNIIALFQQNQRFQICGWDS